MKPQCKATTNIRGEVMRCEGNEGHTSAHFCGTDWWSNTSGLPDNQQHGRIPWFWLWLGLAVVVGVIVYLVTR